MCPISFPQTTSRPPVSVIGVAAASRVAVSLPDSPSIAVAAYYQGARWPLHALRHRLGKQLATTPAWIMWPSPRPRFMFTLQVAAYNSEGKSNPSQVVEFITNPDKPGSPCRPVIRGRVQPNSFKMAWGERQQHLTIDLKPPPQPPHPTTSTSCI